MFYDSDVLRKAILMPNSDHTIFARFYTFLEVSDKSTVPRAIAVSRKRLTTRSRGLADEGVLCNPPL